VQVLVTDSSNDTFKKCFREYKTSNHPNIDVFCNKLFEAFFGDEFAVCHLEVDQYMKKK